MSEEFWRPHLKVSRERERKPGEILWTVQKGHDTYRAELRHVVEFGVELQIHLNEQLVHGQHHPIRAMAMSEASRLLSFYRGRGFTKV